MRKVTVVMDSAVVRRVLPKKYRPFLDMVEYVEGVHILRIDPARGVKMVIVNMKLRPGHRMDELSGIANVKVLDILKQADDLYTVLVKAEGDRRFRNLAKLFPLDVSYELPFRYDSEKIVLSFVAGQRAIGLVLRAFRLFGKVLDVRIQRAIVSDTDPVAILTERQKEAMVAARRLGYYDIPRKADTTRVARELRLSKSTTLEHLRKAEKRLINQILSGR